MTAETLQDRLRGFVAWVEADEVHHYADLDDLTAAADEIDRLRLSLGLAHDEAQRLRSERDSARAAIANIVANVAAAHRQGKP